MLIASSHHKWKDKWHSVMPINVIDLCKKKENIDESIGRRQKWAPEIWHVWPRAKLRRSGCLLLTGQIVFCFIVPLNANLSLKVKCFILFYIISFLSIIEILFNHSTFFLKKLGTMKLKFAMHLTFEVLILVIIISRSLQWYFWLCGDGVDIELHLGGFWQ